MGGFTRSRQAATNPDELLQAYRRWAREHVEAEDPEVSTAAHARLVEVTSALRAQGAERRILELLNDASASVRYCAGYDALYLAPEDGLRVLRALADGPPSKARTEASMTLWVREQGDLVLYPWEREGQE